MYAFLKAVIVAGFGSLLGRLGFRIFVGAALAVLIDDAIDMVIRNVETLPDGAVRFLTVTGIIEGLSIILSALATKASLRPVKIVAGGQK